MIDERADRCSEDQYDEIVAGVRDLVCFRAAKTISNALDAKLNMKDGTRADLQEGDIAGLGMLGISPPIPFPSRRALKDDAR